MVRVNDTRYFHDFSTNYVLREYTNKECGVKQLRLPLPMFGDPNLISPHLPLNQSIYEKITWINNQTATQPQSASQSIIDV